ncbi:hypothetical protein FRUB_02249 [Fimbriiglobus ruber]|uniref:Pyrrolo-quinoline quinone repeat domain-containing protein n=2 Tax=Fimbriiglobus ruber TaxID=1908690 RepID=A0A225E7A7_9BACT|nr:hypothetical protein FRUB_02249 [Fimbriiglobus ruber]
MILATALALAAGNPRPVAAQVVKVQAVPVPAAQVGKDGEDPSIGKPDGYVQFVFPKNRDDSERLKAVIEYMEKKTVPWDVVTSTAQQLLDNKSDSFFVRTDTKSGKDAGNRVSVKAKINELIGEFPKEGRQFYELTYGPPADALLKEAVQNGYDKTTLADVSQRYFHTRAGAQATLLLATLDLETGNYTEAAYGFHRLLARPEGDDTLTPRALFKAVVAFRRTGDARQAETAAKLWDRLEKKFPRDGVVFGRKTYSLEDLKKELDHPAELLGQIGDGFVSMRYGNPTHTGLGDSGTPFLDPSFAFPMLYRTDDQSREGSEWVRQKLEESLKQLDRAKGQVAIPGFFPVTAPNVIIYRTYDGVYAVSTRDTRFPVQDRNIPAGGLVWMSPTRGGAQSVMSGNGRQSAQIWWQQYWATRMPTVLFENAQAGSLCHDGKFVYFVDDLAILTPPQMFNPEMGFPQPNGIATTHAGDFSRLIALNIDTGKMVWELGGPGAVQATDQDEESTTNTQKLTENSYFLGPPLPVNGKLFSVYEKNSQIKLVCMNPYVQAKGSKPELVWTQNLGSPTTPLSQDSLRRIQPAYLAFADGVMICPTNSGAVVAVDVNARSLLWARYYGEAQKEAPVQPGIRQFPGGFNARNPQGANLTLPHERWRASAPIIAGGKVVFTAHDSNQLQCLALRTGELVWSDARRADDLYVGGVVGDKVLVVGKESVRAYALGGDGKGKPSVVWESVSIGTPCGHGIAGKDGLFYVPVVGSPDKTSKEAQVWVIDVNTGRVKSKTTIRRKGDGATDPRFAIGNLVFHDGQLFSQSATDVTAFPLIELKKREMDRLLKNNPRDPVGLADRGELQLDDGKIREAIADFKAANQNNPPELVRKKIRQKLYLAYTDLLRDDFAAGESILNEYEALCEVPIESDDPAEKQRLMDEQVRRKGLYLALVAKGREKQGRLAEAFDHYRAFAALGDNKQLVAIYDEPNGTTRPDVWARGKIDSMIRHATDPAVRKPLEERVQKDWDGVRTANDLTRLREFVKVFGPYFPAGREAQLLLAEKLLQTNNDEDLREAQTQLMQLWATADDPPTAAKAVEALARVMTRRGMLEDAVGLYAQLGTKYADVTIRDGKTGADIYGDLITDKRLLPYLEPSPGPTSSRYKVDVQQGQGAMNRLVLQSFALTPEGDLFPFFRRFSLTMESSPNQDGSWALKVIDRYTGEERCKFGGLTQIMTLNGINQGMPTYRIAQANGHLVLLTIGQFAYCFDLAEKRELWRYNLIGAGAAPYNNPPRMEMADGDALFSYEDGWTLRLGRSAVLQPTYTCLVTRDGLVALDPATGQKLWVRSNVSPKVQIFGDAKHVFLVEGSNSRVIRAVDGTTVAGAKDFAGVFTGTSRVGVFGRLILLNEGGGEDKPRTLRLYDPLNGQDVWTKEYPPKSLLIKTLDPELTGCLNAEGDFEVLAARTGKIIFRGAVDPARREPHLVDSTGRITATQPVVLADADRVYLFLNKPGGQANYYSTMIRHLPVNGAAYGFDRATGKRLWFTDRLFENQLLLLERFDDLPVLVAAGQVMDETTKTFSYQVAILDKQLGKLKLHRQFPQNGFFVAAFSEPKTRVVEFWRYDLRVRIVPETDGKGDK